MKHEKIVPCFLSLNYFVSSSGTPPSFLVVAMAWCQRYQLGNPPQPHPVGVRKACSLQKHNAQFSQIRLLFVIQNLDLIQLQWLEKMTKIYIPQTVVIAEWEFCSWCRKFPQNKNDSKNFGCWIQKWFQKMIWKRMIQKKLSIFWVQIPRILRFSGAFFPRSWGISAPNTGKPVDSMKVTKRPG